MDKGLDEVKSMLLSFDQRLRLVENSNSANGPLTSLLVDQAREHAGKLDQHATQIAKLFVAMGKQSDSLESVTNVLRWVLGVFTLLIVAVLVALLTGKATIVFHP